MCASLCELNAAQSAGSGCAAHLGRRRVAGPLLRAEADHCCRSALAGVILWVLAAWREEFECWEPLHLVQGCITSRLLQVWVAMKVVAGRASLCLCTT